MDKKYWKVNPYNPEERIKTDKELDEYGFNYRLKYCKIRE